MLIFHITEVCLLLYVARLLYRIKHNIRSNSMTLQDIQTKIATLTQDVADENTVIGSAETLLSGLTTTLTEVKKELTDALASQDPAALQSVSDSLDAVITTVSGEKTSLASAITTNTPAA